MKKLMGIFALCVAFSLALTGCSGTSSSANQEQSKGPSEEDVLTAYSNGNDTEAEEILQSLEVGEDSYPCYRAIGLAKNINSNDRREDSVKEFEYSLRLAGSSQAGAQILADHFDELAAAARIVKDEESIHFESIYKTLADIANAHDLADALESAIPDGEEKIEEIENEERESSAARMESATKYTASKDDIDQKLLEQEIYCSAPEKRVSHPEYKSLYPDYIHVDSVQNNSDKIIRDVTISIAAWDENGMPVRIHSPYRSTDENVYIISVLDANTQPGDTWTCEENFGWSISEQCTHNVAQVKGIVWKCTFTDGTTWTNPIADNWAYIYVNKPL